MYRDVTLVVNILWAWGFRVEKEWLRSTRTDLGFSQAGFARALGVSRQTVIRWELGIAKPAGYLELALRYLIYVKRNRKTIETVREWIRLGLDDQVHD